MNLRQFYVGKAIGFTVLILALGVVAGFYTLNNYIYQEKQGEDVTFEPYRAGLSGRYVCLPHKDTSASQTMECAFGLQTEGGEYYAIDFNLMSQAYQDIAGGSYLSANGIVTPVERLSSDHWQTYNIEGIFSVTDSLEIQAPLKGENMEGEADPARMTLGMNTWRWVADIHADGKRINRADSKQFTLTFESDGRFSATGDCNAIGGTYTTDGKKNISFSQIFSTKMYCEGSKENDFTSMLRETVAYNFTSRGELILQSKFDGRLAVFR